VGWIVVEPLPDAAAAVQRSTEADVAAQPGTAPSQSAAVDSPPAAAANAQSTAPVVAQVVKDVNERYPDNYVACQPTYLPPASGKYGIFE